MTIEAWFVYITSGLIVASSATTYMIHEGIIGFGQNANVNERVVSRSNYNSGVAQYDIFEAAEECKKVIYDSVQAEVSQLIYDERSSRYEEDRNINIIYYEISVKAGKLGLGKSSAYRAMFGCHVSAVTNEVLSHDTHGYKKG